MEVPNNVLSGHAPLLDDQQPRSRRVWGNGGDRVVECMDPTSQQNEPLILSTTVSEANKLNKENTSQPQRTAEPIEKVAEPVQKEAKKVRWALFSFLFAISLPLFGLLGWIYLAMATRDTKSQEPEVAETTFHDAQLTGTTYEEFLEAYSRPYEKTFKPGEEEGTRPASDGRPIIQYELARGSKEYQGITLTGEVEKTLNRGGFAYPIYYQGNKVSTNQFLGTFKTWSEDQLVEEPSLHQVAGIAQVYLGSIFLAPYTTSEETDMILSTGLLPHDRADSQSVTLLPGKDSQNSEYPLGRVYTLESKRTVDFMVMSGERMGEIEKSYEVTERVEITKKAYIDPTSDCEVRVIRTVKEITT
ncbi:MAG: hypothetical protein H7A38_04365 [Chlamydiales bacterium]|nr:hypothetical protein [Chlamydiales bacterium]